MLERSQSVFEGFINAGTASKSWFAIFSLLQRLRQACDHVSLTVNNKAERGELAHSKEDGFDLPQVVQSSSGDGEGAVDGKVSNNVFIGLSSTLKYTTLD